MDCDWFLEAVLPLDKELCKEVWQALNGQDGPAGDRTRWCAICNASFIPTSPQQKYCISCGERAKQLRNRKKQRKYDEKKQTEKLT